MFLIFEKDEDKMRVRRYNLFRLFTKLNEQKQKHA